MDRRAVAHRIAGTAAPFALAGLVLLAVAPGAAQEGSEPGRLLFNNACRTCHALRSGDNRLGPHLAGVVGRKAGTVEGYGYSAALRDSGLTWDRATLDRFIAAPDEVAPGHAMRPYGGLSSAEDRSKLIAFLESQT